MESDSTTKAGSIVSIPLAVLIAGAMISGAVLYADGGISGGSKVQQAAVGAQQDDPTVTPSGPVDVSADDDPALGNPNAKVTVIEFSDFQCPFCRVLWKDTLPQLKKEYIDTGKIRFVYRDYPLPFHEGAAPYAQAAQCADDQGKFWEYHDKIFQEQDKSGQGTVPFVGVATLKTWARDLGLDGGSFDQCLDSDKYKAEVEKDAADGVAAGVSGTPSTFVNGRILVGAQPFDAFKKLIDEELNK